MLLSLFDRLDFLYSWVILVSKIWTTRILKMGSSMGPIQIQTGEDPFPMSKTLAEEEILYLA